MQTHESLWCIKYGAKHCEGLKQNKVASENL